MQNATLKIALARCLKGRDGRESELLFYQIKKSLCSPAYKEQKIQCEMATSDLYSLNSAHRTGIRPRTSLKLCDTGIKIFVRSYFSFFIFFIFDCLLNEQHVFVHTAASSELTTVAAT